VIHLVPGYSGIPQNEEPDCQANDEREGRGYTVLECLNTSAVYRARQISERRLAEIAQWEGERRSKPYRYRRNGEAGSRRSVPIRCVKALAARLSRWRSGYAMTEFCRTRFGHREDNICWLCRGGALQTHEHLFHDCSPWKVQQTTLWQPVGKATRWKAGRC